MGEKEGVGLAAALGMFVLGFVGDQCAVAFGAGAMRQVGVTHQPLRHALGIEIDQRGQRTGNQQLRDTDAKRTGDQFDADHQAQAIQLCPEGW